MSRLSFVATLLLSFSSLADTTLLFSVFVPGTGEPQFEITATFTGDTAQLREAVLSEGQVSAAVPMMNETCTGQYVIDFAQSEKQLTVVFNGLNGPGTTGGCHNSSLNVTIDRAQLERVLEGKTEIVTFRNIRSDAQRQASVRKID